MTKSYSKSISLFKVLQIWARFMESLQTCLEICKSIKYFISDFQCRNQRKISNFKHPPDSKRGKGRWAKGDSSGEIYGLEGNNNKRSL